MAKPTLIWSGLAVGIVAVLAAQIEGRQTAQPAASQPIASGFGAGAYRPGPGVNPPIFLDHKALAPEYTVKAIQVRGGGDVELEAIVGTSGAVENVHIVRPFGASVGLDDSAMSAARSLQFLPAVVSGRSVRSVVGITTTFNAPPSAAVFPQASIRVTGASRAEVLRSALDETNLVSPQTAGLVEPVLLVQSEPSYTREAMDHHVSGRVTLKAVVLADGSVGEVRIRKSLDAEFGLDLEAVRAARRWLFKPATLNGRAVATTVVLELSFRTG